MSDNNVKKPNYTMMILIALGILVLVLGVGLYLLWRKMTSSDIKLATTSKTADELRVQVVKLEQEIKYKNEKLQDINSELSELRNRNTKLDYDIKMIKKDMKYGKPNKIKQCDDMSCTSTVESIE